MKKGLFTSALVLPLVAMGLGSGATVLAADTEEFRPTPEVSEITKKSNATVKVKAGALELTKVPHLNFKAVTVKSIADNENTPTGLNHRGVSQLVLGDYRGNNALGWKLSAKLSDLTTRGDKLDKAHVALKLTPQRNTTMPGHRGDATLVAGSRESTPLVATDKDHKGKGTGVYNTDATLHIGQQMDVSAGDYSGTVTWTLASTRA